MIVEIVHYELTVVAAAAPLVVKDSGCSWTMADVFISYQHRDRVICERMARALERKFLSVWWDDQLHPRESWDRIIEREIEAAKAVVVLWTPNAVQSDWVREEARYAKDRGKLVPARMASCAIPLGFGNVQTEDLDSWSGDAEDPRWVRFLGWIDVLVGPRASRKAFTASRQVTVVPVVSWDALGNRAKRVVIPDANGRPDPAIIRRTRVSKYRRLFDHLMAAQGSLPVTITFAEIDALLQSKLPDSAERDRSWWANTSHGSHVQARAWLDAGCVVEDVNFEARHVTFARDPVYGR